jgi:hypothetical protein
MIFGEVSSSTSSEKADSSDMLGRKRVGCTSKDIDVKEGVLSWVGAKDPATAPPNSVASQGGTISSVVMLNLSRTSLGGGFVDGNRADPASTLLTSSAAAMAS